MNEYRETLKQYVMVNLPNWGEYDAKGVLDMLYSCCNQDNPMDTLAITAACEEMYGNMHGMPLWEMDRISDAVCMLCRDHEKAGSIQGVKIGIHLAIEIT